jgi:hypothetical protein
MKYKTKTKKVLHLKDKSDKSDKSDIITISKASTPRKLFYSKKKTAYHLSRTSFYNKKDKIIEFIDDYLHDLNKGKVINANIIEQKIFNHDPDNCICQNIDTTKKSTIIDDNCKCTNLKKYSSQGKSGASINSIECNGVNDILKVMPLENYYIKKRDETNKYIFLEMDYFTIQTIINTYVYRELPFNTVSINNSGVCKKSKSQFLGKNFLGYNLMSEADLGSGQDFINKLLNGNLDKEFNIQGDTALGRDTIYKIFVNFLLQSICIIGHLRFINLEFYHGDYKPDNVFIKRLSPSEHAYFHFKISGRDIKIPNMGFAVLIADFDRSSISLKSLNDNTKKTYRIISPIRFKPLLAYSVNKTIKKYGNSNPDNGKPVNISKFGISMIIPKSQDPTLTILRAAGVRYFQDTDLYTFMVMLLNSNKIKNYFLEKELDKTIMSFMTDKFQDRLFNMNISDINMNHAGYLILDILDKIKEPIHNIFTKNYIKSLDLLNLYLFEPK